MKTLNRLLIAGILGLITMSIQAQDNPNNPFAKYGVDVEVLTLSNGEFEEFFDRDSIVQIGSAMYNTKSKKVIGFVEQDTMYSEATLEPEITSRWLSPDPLAAKFPEWSPYTAFADNPIYYVDPDGKAFKASNDEANESLYNIVQSLGGQDFFGLEVRGQGKATYYVTTLSMSVDKFSRMAEKSGLSGDDLNNAVAFYKTLKADDVYEVALVSNQSQAYVSNPWAVHTQNSDLDNFMNTISQDNSLTPAETQQAIDNALPLGNPSGSDANSSYGYFPDQSNTTIRDVQSSQTKNVAGILVINPQYQLQAVPSFVYETPEQQREKKRVEEQNKQTISTGNQNATQNAINSLSNTIQE